MTTYRVDTDVQILIEHLEARGIKIDTLLTHHLNKISNRLSENKQGVSTVISRAAIDKMIFGSEQKEPQAYECSEETKLTANFNDNLR